MRLKARKANYFDKIKEKDFKFRWTIECNQGSSFVFEEKGRIVTSTLPERVLLDRD